MLKAKLCGMKTIEAARAAETAGADFIGFIFWRKSHRFVEPEVAASIGAALQSVKTVGVFVDEEPAVVNAIAKQCHLDFVQLHGHEDAAYAKQMEVPVIKAYRYGDGFSAEAANAFPAAMILVDAYQEGAAGGTGTCFDWQRAQREVAAIRKPVLIAGGISEANVAEVNDIFHPFAVDVSGSLEVNREKSAARIAAFMAQIKKINGRN
ncbi:MAG: phosphoribosylanthranilate isomerase [Mitsuokella sp.]|uniref:phosphoribosylanthranilate isomerase n=1 Tax=Mitsuokella sp. TaxID=2049034 RepID=UPI003F07834B